MMTKSKAAVGEPGRRARLAGQRDIGGEQRGAAGEMRHCPGAPALRSAKAAISGAFSTSTTVRLRAARRDGKTGGAGAGAEIGEPSGKAGRHRGGQHHGIHAGAMARALRLHQPETAAVKGVDRRGWFDAGIGMASALSRRDLVADAGVGKDAARLGRSRRRRP